MKSKQKLENILLPIAKRMDVNPNILTLSSLVLTLISAYYVLSNAYLAAAFPFLIASLLDAMDGLVAKTHNRETKFGAFLDEIIDRLNDGIIIIAIILTGETELIAGLLALLLVLLSSYMSAVMDSLSKKRIGEIISFRPIRCAVVFFGLVLAQLNAIIWLLLFIGLWTAIYRMFKANWVLNSQFGISMRQKYKRFIKL